MSDLPGYARAQREYEEMEPPSGGPTECDACGGSGQVPNDDDLEGDLLECAWCEGNGHVTEDGKPFDPNKAENDACDRADMQRDERLTNPPDAGADDEY